MKKNFVLTLLVLSMLCVFTTGCGSRKNDTTDTNSNSTVQDTMDNNGGSSGSGSSNSSNNGGSLMDDVEQGLENAGDAITGNNGSNGATSGVPYDDLLNNGSVSDHDGNLNNDAGSSASSSRRR